MNTGYIRFLKSNNSFKLSLPPNTNLTGYGIESTIIGNRGLANDDLPYLYTYGATEIGDESFMNTNIEKIFISNNIIKMGDSVFSGLSLEEIIFESGSQIQFSPSTFLNISKSPSQSLSKINIYYNPDDYVSGFINGFVDINIVDDLCYNSIYENTFLVLYQDVNNVYNVNNVNNVNKYWVRVNQSIQNVEAKAIMEVDISSTFVSLLKPIIDNTDIREILFSRDIITIGQNAFSLFENLKILDFSGNQSLINIHDEAFKQCPNIVKVLFPNTIQNIGARAFYGCSRLEFLYFPIYSSGDMTCGTECFYEVAKILSINYECTGGMNEMKQIRTTFNAVIDPIKTTANFLFSINVKQPDY